MVLFKPLNSDGLILMALCSNHHISFIQHKYIDLFEVKEP